LKKIRDKFRNGAIEYVILPVSTVGVSEYPIKHGEYQPSTDTYTTDTPQNDFLPPDWNPESEAESTIDSNGFDWATGEQSEPIVPYGIPVIPVTIGQFANFFRTPPLALLYQ